MNPEFSSVPFLEGHIQKTLDFYAPNVLDTSGGFFQHFRDTGTVYDKKTRHLVSSTRFIFNYAMAARYFQESKYLTWVQHGLDYVLQQHRQANGGFSWMLEQDEKGQIQVLDDTNHAYGLAFIMIAGATALLAGMLDGRPALQAGWDILERYFWDAKQGLYRDEAPPDFSRVLSYRGQNTNMHACEAMLWAFEATNEVHYLDKAYTLAESVTQKLAAQSTGVCQGLVWEHYQEDSQGHWRLDLNYNRNNPKHLFRPWGYQPGHQTEWAKLLLILARHRPASWQLPRARHLFDHALALAWDKKHGGICYGFDPNGQVCDDDKYFWVQAESLAAAQLLFAATEEPQYREWYTRIWQYSWEHMVDQRHGAWFRILRRNSQPYNDLKSPAGKTDYHTMGACYEVLRCKGRSSVNQ